MIVKEFIPTAYQTHMLFGYSEIHYYYVVSNSRIWTLQRIQRMWGWYRNLKKSTKHQLWANGAHWSCCLLFTYLFLDSPLVMAVGAADVGWGLVVMLFLLLLLVMSGLDVSSALHFFTARGFFHHRTAVLLRTMQDRHKDKFNRCWREKTKAEKRRLDEKTVVETWPTWAVSILSVLEVSSSLSVLFFGTVVC